MQRSIIIKMWDFKFQAPRYHNFFRKQKQNATIQINRQNKNDMWFLEEHSELTPPKQLNNHLFDVSQDKNTKIVCPQKAPEQIQISRAEKTEQLSVHSKNHSLQCILMAKREERDQPRQAQRVAPKQKIEKLKRNDIDQKSKRESQRSVITFAGLGRSLIQKEIKNKKKQIQPVRQKQVNKLEKVSKARSSPNPEKKRAQKEEIMKIRIPCPYSRKIQKDWQTRSSKSWYELSQKSAKKAIESMRKSLRKSLNQSKGHGSKDKHRFKF